MNRSADRLRILREIFLITNLVIFFLPELSIRQENYPEQTFSQFRFVRQYLLASSADMQTDVSGSMRLFTFLFILLPVVLSLLCCIGALVGRIPDRYIVIGEMAAGILYLLHLLTAEKIWPQRLNDAQSYDHRIAWWLLMITIFGMLATGVLLCIMAGREKTAGKKALAPEYVPEAETPVPELHQSKEIRKGVSGNSDSTKQQGGVVPADRHRGLQAQDDAVSQAQDDAVSQASDDALSQTQTEINISMALSLEQAIKQVDISPSDSPKGVMVGLAGVFHGAEITMKDGEVMNLGRELSNDLVFQDAPHVSRNHCSITWQAERQKYLLEDRSSNGCYINDALERIPKNVPVAVDPGTVIDIGDRTNRFRLE